MASSDNVQNILGYDSADNMASTSNVVANADGSIVERIEYLIKNNIAPVYNAPNYLAVPITFAAGTTGSVATHEIFTVTGAVRVIIIPECTVNVASGAGATIELGVAGGAGTWIGATTATDIDAGKLWLDTNPSELSWSWSSVLDKVVSGGLDIGYEVKVDTLTSGDVTFHCWYWPLNSTGAVVAANGTATL